MRPLQCHFPKYKYTFRQFCLMLLPAAAPQQQQKRKKRWCRSFQKLMEKAWSHFYKFIFCQSTLASSKAMPLPGSQPFGLVCERHSGNIIYRLCKARMIHFGWSPSGFFCFLFSGIFLYHFFFWHISISSFPLFSRKSPIAFVKEHSFSEESILFLAFFISAFDICV